MLMTLRSDGKDLLNRVRVELARLRKEYARQGQPPLAFGFRIEGPFYARIGGVSVEMHHVSYRITKLQQMKNLALTTD